MAHIYLYIIFINRGADISVSNAAGNTPLMTAIIAGNIEVLLQMLKAINECDKKMSFRDILSLNAKNNKTVLTWAIESDHTVLIEVSVISACTQALTLTVVYHTDVGHSPT